MKFKVGDRVSPKIDDELWPIIKRRFKDLNKSEITEQSEFTINSIGIRYVKITVWDTRLNKFNYLKVSENDLELIT